MEGSIPKNENKENINSQIEKQMQMLNPKFDALKSDIDAMGGMEGLSKSIERNKEVIERNSLASALTSGPKIMTDLVKERPIVSIMGTSVLFALVTALSSVDHSGQLNVNILIEALGTTAGSFAGMSAALSTPDLMDYSPIKKLKSWWENKKLKSLKNKAEVAGIA
jgi:hypothetical protein